MARVPFTKMHALGNDFVVIRAAAGAAPPAAARIRALADRRTGIGFDQLLWLEPAGSAGADIAYRVFNTDGSEAEQCGNGARCIASLIAGGQPRELVLESVAGRISARVDAAGTVSVAMGVPEFRPERIPFAAEATQPDYQIAVGSESLRIGVVSLGNPHAVLIVDDVAGAEVARLGAALERHERFPNRANIGFMEVADRGHIRLRVFERGVGETRACGTGACAAAVIGRTLGLLDEEVDVALPGGQLTVRWSGPGRTVWLTGEAVTVFEGTVEI